jgi:pseudaminic acid biosynthesis-associated methylase
MTMNEQQQFWAGKFGNEYVRRNQVDWRARIPFWREVIEMTGARSVHEVGCNCGWNLSAIKRVDPYISQSGNDVNLTAISQARSVGLSAFHGENAISKAELVFTAGVLIHVAPDDLKPLMQKIVDQSYRYVLAVEYESEQEEEIEYRGHTGKLWRRPFGRMYEEMGLKLVRHEQNVPGFDSCTAWLLEK